MMPGWQPFPEYFFPVKLLPICTGVNKSFTRIQDLMKKLQLVLFLSILSIAAQAQVQWPPVTQTMKPWTRWWWQGSAVDKEGLAAAMKQYQAAGLGGLEVTPIYGVKGEEQKFIPFLSPKWVDMFRFTLSEAKKLDLGIDMATGTGWPFGGPWITPEDACKNIQLKTYSLKGGQTLSEPVRFVQQPFVKTVGGNKVDINTLSYPIATNKDMQAYAFDQVQYEKLLPLQTLMAYGSNDQVVDLTAKVDASGKLNWKAPAGEWQLYALFMGWHGKLVERAAPGGEGDAIDHFSVQALNKHLHVFDTAFAGKDISYLRSYFNDSYEVDDAKGQSTWTPDLLKEFQQRRGYDLRQYLPALFSKDNDELHTRILYDYRLTIGELLLDKFTTPWHQWAARQGKLIRNQSHGSPANILDLYAAIDIPETEGDDILRYKFATSAAHVTGKPLASSESATWLNEHFLSSLGDVKQAVDKFFIGGVNHIFYHGTNYSPQQEVWPGWLFYAATHLTPANPEWRNFGALNRYVARTQSFLQQGNADNDVLVYFPYNDKISEPGKNLLQHFDGMKGFKQSVFEKAGTFLLDSGYSFDLISDKQLMNVTANGKRLETGGITYQAILVPAVKYMPVATLEQLVKLARNGATIIWMDHLPESTPGFASFKENQSRFQQVWQPFEFLEQGNLTAAKAGDGVFYLGNDLQALLDAAQVTREQFANKGLQFVRRSWAYGKTYFITNPGDKIVEGYVKLAVKGAGAALYDPMSGESGVAKMRAGSKGGMEVFITLQPGESCILQTSANTITGSPFPYNVGRGIAQEIKGTWDLKFISGGPSLPAPMQLKKLQSWTDTDDEDLQSFSGTAEYSIHFPKPATAAKSWILDLGKVGESVAVILNGQVLDTLIGPTYQVSIPATMLKGNNHLQLQVTNSMANRIIYLEKHKAPWKKFYNINMPAHKAANRGKDGLLDVSGWQPKAAGLLTPVTLTPVSGGYKTTVNRKLN